jgi:hypothetical protein
MSDQNQVMNDLMQIHASIEGFKTKIEMLERENEFLRKLVETMSKPVSNPDTFKVPSTPYNPYPWERQYGPIGEPKCGVCGLSGITGYVCNHQNCPSRVSYATNTDQT